MGEGPGDIPHRVAGDRAGSGPDPGQVARGRPWDVHWARELVKILGVVHEMDVHPGARSRASGRRACYSPSARERGVVVCPSGQDEPRSVRGLAPHRALMVGTRMGEGAPLAASRVGCAMTALRLRADCNTTAVGEEPGIFRSRLRPHSPLRSSSSVRIRRLDPARTGIRWLNPGADRYSPSRPGRQDRRVPDLRKRRPRWYPAG